MIRTQVHTEAHDMNSFLAGLGLGFGLGVLFAPMSGQELRDSIADRAGDIADTARDQYAQARETAGAAISSIRGQAENRSGTSNIRTGTE
jgi:gas vesicle protein